MSKNDDKILLLKQKIAEKKDAIGQTDHFSPLTSCSIELNGVRYNLHAADKDTLVLLACQLHSIRFAAEATNLLDQCMISGFHLTDWISDINKKLNIASKKAELAKLKAMEAQLNKLLSNDKKTELEIDSIAEALNI